MTRRYIAIEVDEDWHDNAAMDEVQALPCSSRFWGPMSLPRNIAISIERNPHRLLYISIRDFIAGGVRIDATELERAEASGELWVVTWNPDTVVGSCCVGASTMERALVLAAEGDE